MLNAQGWLKKHNKYTKIIDIYESIEATNSSGIRAWFSKKTESDGNYYMRKRSKKTSLQMTEPTDTTQLLKLLLLPLLNLEEAISRLKRTSPIKKNVF